ncbi:MAG: hypothetical protein ACTHNN_02085 [Xanthobacteraceae bacterium]
MAQQFDAYGSVVPYMRNENARVETGVRVRPRRRVGLTLFWLAVVLIVLVRIACFSTAQTSGFAGVEGARQVDVR